MPCGDRPVIDRALDALAAAGVRRVVVVDGHGGDRLRAHLAGRREPAIAHAGNAAYDRTNTLASLLVAAALVDEDFLLLDGDLVFEPAVLRALGGPGTALAVDRSRPLDDDAVKVATAGQRVVAVGKALPPGLAAAAESIGVARIDRRTARRVFAAGRSLLASGAAQAYYEAAFQQVIQDGAVFRAADVTGLRWVEIDDHEDLRRAQRLFVAA